MAHKAHYRRPVVHRYTKELRALARELDETERREEKRHQALIVSDSLNGQDIDYLDAVNYT